MESLELPPTTLTRASRTLGWWLRAARLLLSILVEGACSLVQFALFPLRRRRERARIAAIIQGKAGVLAAFLGCWAASLAAGCKTERPFPGSSFSHQVDELGASTLDLIDMRDARSSLEEDLYSMAEMEPASELWWDLKHLLTAPEAQESLASDLEELADPELGALAETFEMFGW